MVTLHKKLFATLFSLLLLSSAAKAADYEILYRAKVHPDSDVARVEIRLRGERLPSQLTLSLDPERHRSVTAEHGLRLDDNSAVWKPREPEDSLHYEFVIDEQKASGRYDSLLTEHWAILRSDKLVPPIAARVPKGLEGQAELQFLLPEGWSVAAPYPTREEDSARYLLSDPGRIFPRPKGWLILGEITSRQDIIAGTDVRVAAPAGQGDRLQDTLAFIGWNLPAVKAVLPGFPDQLLIVTAGKPMWRGGLSGTRSLFMHADRPMISGNRTSSLIHELIHVGTGISGGKRADWIVEGLPPFSCTGSIRRWQRRQTVPRALMTSPAHWRRIAVVSPWHSSRRSSPNLPATRSMWMH